jgi:hypothetical protein
MNPNERQPMLKRLRGRLTYANVVATLALFIALGGSSYAALTVTGSNVRNGSLTGKDIKRNSLTGRHIREGQLKAVPRARNAAHVGGLTAQRLLLKCPPDTLTIASVCIERQPRSPGIYDVAVRTCADVDSTATPGRRLPTHGELRKAFDYDQIGPIAAGGELTGEVYPSSAIPGDVSVLYLTDELGRVGLVENRAGDERAFRCVTEPVN